MREAVNHDEVFKISLAAELERAKNKGFVEECASIGELATGGLRIDLTSIIIVKGKPLEEHFLTKTLKTLHGGKIPENINTVCLIVENKSPNDRLNPEKLGSFYEKYFWAKEKGGSSAEVAALLAMAAPLPETFTDTIKRGEKKDYGDFTIKCEGSWVEGYYLISVEGRRGVMPLVLANLNELSDPLSLLLTLPTRKKREIHKVAEWLISLPEESKIDEVSYRKLVNYFRRMGGFRILSDEEIISDALREPLIAEGAAIDLVRQGRMETLAKLIEKLVESHRPGIAEPEEVVTTAIKTIKEIGDPQRKAELARSLAEIATEKLPPEKLTTKIVEMIKAMPDRGAKLELALKALDRLPPEKITTKIVEMMEAMPDMGAKLELALKALDRLPPEKITTIIVGVMEAVPDMGARRVLFSEASAKAPEEMKIIAELLKRLSLI
ncbi:MAG: hypothetical protein QXQ05_11715 [Candidatus Jordarchaeales archaeon]